MSGIENLKQYEARPSIGSPVRVRADPDLVSDVACSTPVSSEVLSRREDERRYQEDITAWESIADLPSEDEDGEEFDKTVATLLIGMNMGQYISLFKDGDVGMNLFLTLTEEDLEVIGVNDKGHRVDIAHGIANIRKTKGSLTQVRGLRDDISDATLSVQETIPVMCHTVKHINNLVILLRNYRTRLNSNTVRNQVLDSHHSAAMGVKILTKEALAQAELLKIQLHGLLVKLDPLRPSKSLSRRAKGVGSPKAGKDGKVLLGAVLMSAGISLSLLLALLLRK